MHAEITPVAGSDVTVDIPTDGRVEIYRVENRDNEVVARVVNGEPEVIGFGVHDLSVSRRGSDADPRYIELYRDGPLFVVDRGSSEGVELVPDVFQQVKLEAGEEYTIHQDAKLLMGYDTEFRISVTQDRDRSGDEQFRVYIQECEKWIQYGSNHNALRVAQQISDELQTRSDTEIGTDAHSEFENFVSQVRNQVNRDIGEDRSDEGVPEHIRQKGERELNRLRNIYLD